jgi:hypothetical protein
VGIQRLRALAGPLRASAQQALKVLAGSEKRARSSGAKEAATAAQLAARGTALDQAVDQLLERSERDNESIYMVAVPPGLQPPPVEAKTLVGACVKCCWLCPCHEHTAVLLPPSPLAADTALPDITRVRAGWLAGGCNGLSWVPGSGSGPGFRRPPAGG